MEGYWTQKKHYLDWFLDTNVVTLQQLLLSIDMISIGTLQSNKVVGIFANLFVCRHDSIIMSYCGIIYMGTVNTLTSGDATWHHNTQPLFAQACCLKSPSLYLPYGKVHGANMGPIWGRQDPGEPHAGPMNFAIWVVLVLISQCTQLMPFSCEMLMASISKMGLSITHLV